jgi:hypothetical protein
MPLSGLLHHLRRFVLERHTDATGVSGTGTVAAGVQFPDGRCAMEWWAEPAASIALFDRASDILLIHGHEGATTLRWIDMAADV